MKSINEYLDSKIDFNQMNLTKGGLAQGDTLRICSETTCVGGASDVTREYGGDDGTVIFTITSPTDGNCNPPA